jgi:hypothetical protein
MNMWLTESRAQRSGIACKFECPVCDAVENAIISQLPAV